MKSHSRVCHEKVIKKVTKSHKSHRIIYHKKVLSHKSHSIEKHDSIVCHKKPLKVMKSHKKVIFCIVCCKKFENKVIVKVIRV